MKCLRQLAYDIYRNYVQHAEKNWGCLVEDLIKLRLVENPIVSGGDNNPGTHAAILDE